MADTKERILETALHFFAEKGYDATSVKDIADEIGITKGALYRHYANKRDIFDSIIRRMESLDRERAEAYMVPEEPVENSRNSYKSTEINDLAAYTYAQFVFWTEDPFASSFRKMLTLEQYRNREMTELYQQYLSGGPLGYVEDLFREMYGSGDGFCAEQLAAKFYGPVYLLISRYDGAHDEKEKKNIAKKVSNYIEYFKNELADKAGKQEQNGIH